ncbi:MAG TPA: aldehyde dehydrogenase family protein, partial [Fimbriimonadaceae bacterium]|nr:aldehyde dehydrogenase family protein [Fimbriimonadaceae bacterium]
MRALRQTAEAGPASAESDCFPEIRFTDVQQIANVLADRIEARFEELARVLLTYESFEVVRDETDRTIDLLRSLHENETYFERRIGEVVAFLPRNQPLYAFTCFVVVPALMASSVHFRIPHAMRHFFPELLRVLGVERLLSNIVVSPLGRTEFLRERSALRRGLARAESYPVTDAVIFTGTPAHADQLRRVFDPRTLFITNGAGHNPLIVAPDADIFAAVDAVIALQFYNQGQDCAAPNAILVHATVLPRFLSLLREGVRQLVVGPYENRACRIGPIGDPADLIRIQKLLVDNRRWLDRSTPGIVRAAEATAEPTIVCRPLREGPNFTELFAPIVVVQGYEHDGELARYFEHPRYAANAMYLSLYGASRYVDELIGRKVDGRVLHDHSSVLRNTHLHAAGVERGTQPYGGSGVGASSLRIGRTLLCRPTLPQRDLWEWIAKPLRCKELRIARTKNLTHALIEYRDNIPKLLRLKDLNPQPQPTAH